MTNINWEELSNNEIINLFHNRDAHATCCPITDNDIYDLYDNVCAAVGLITAGIKSELTRFADLMNNPTVEGALYEVCS